MKIVIDMNLSPEWAAVLENDGFDAVHWSQVGSPSAKDHEILFWAKRHGHVVFTHDLDFGTILAATQADAPSVFQIRTQDVSPQGLHDLVKSILGQYATQLESGALISVNMEKSRVRILPIHP